MADPPQSKDRVTFEREVLAHLPAAYNVALLLLRARMDAEDAVQDATVRAYRAFHQFKGGSPKPWLLAIVRNVCFRRLQERRRVRNVVSIDEALLGGPENSVRESALTASEPSPEQAAVSASDTTLLRRALDGLPPIFREVIVLRELEELSYGEIADVIGAPIGTVMSRLARAREQLRAAVGQLMNEDDRNAV
ncbi:MAG: sigma-70 family RNA polymerase sigma factor [Proteobacteria bacterium]|nr:sigma-70 family RNA polymerase sigma factor [Pseudomonadota bacterium]